MNDINLLSQKKDSRTSNQVLRIFRVTSFISLVAVLLSALIVFFLKLQSPLPSLRNQENNLISRLDAAKEKTAKLFVIHNRLSNIQTILKSRQNYNVDMKKILDKTPNDIVIQSFTFSKVNVAMTVSSGSLASIDTFLNNLVNDTLKKEVFKKVTLKNISLDSKSGTYFLSVEGTLL